MLPTLTRPRAEEVSCGGYMSLLPFLISLRVSCSPSGGGVVAETYHGLCGIDRLVLYWLSRLTSLLR